MPSLVLPALCSEVTPVPPPDVSPPPVDWWYWWDEVIFLEAGVHGKYYVKYDQPDNYFSYYPEEWWTPWAFVVTKIHEHIPADELQDLIDRIEDLTQFLQSRFNYAAAALSIGLA